MMVPLVLLPDRAERAETPVIREHVSGVGASRGRNRAGTPARDQTAPEMYLLRRPGLCPSHTTVNLHDCGD
jgi:hypothetical protein